MTSDATLGQQAAAKGLPATVDATRPPSVRYSYHYEPPRYQIAPGRALRIEQSALNRA